MKTRGKCGRMEAHGTSVVKDINGVSVRKLLDKIIADDLPDTDEASRLIHGRMLPKLPEIMASIEGIVTPLQRYNANCSPKSSTTLTI